MNTQEAHIAELKKQLAESKAENERLVYKLGQQKTAMVDHAPKAREDESNQWEGIYAAARDVLGVAMPNESEDFPGSAKVFLVARAQLDVLKSALEAKRPTPGVYNSSFARACMDGKFDNLAPATKYILRKGDAGFVYFFREGDACWTQDKDAAKRFDTATAASIFAIQRGLGGVEVDPV